MTGADVSAVSEPLSRCVPGVLQVPVTETVFWTGAGISADLPTGAPLGNGLADRALEHCFAANTAKIAADYYLKLRVARSRPGWRRCWMSCAGCMG